MRLLSVAVLGTALVAAGMLAPATGQAAPGGDGQLSVRPGTVRPGERVRISAAGCENPRAGSEVFTSRSAHSVATLRHDAAPGVYAVVAQCGPRMVTGKVRVAGRVGWPDPPSAVRGER